jgi:hypothetical protein
MTRFYVYFQKSIILLPPFIMLILVAILFYSPYAATINPYSFLKPTTTAVAADPPPTHKQKHHHCTKLWALTEPPQAGSR